MTQQTPNLRVRRCIMVLALTTLLVPMPGSAQAAEGSADSGTQIIRVYFPDRDMGNRIFLSFEGAMLETDYEDNYHIMKATSEDLDRLTDTGLYFEIDDTWRPPQPMAALLEASLSAIPSYPCYETVEETFAMAQAMADDHPTLANWLDVGDSWEKTVGQGGYDMMVLVLTHTAIAGDKPKLFMTCSIHAREYATAPLCLEFARHLIDSYDFDPDATWILDNHEIHIMFHANPDGRKQAEAGAMWRKNTNENYCGPTSSTRGADLNRNFEYNWGCCDGSSGDECNETYRGPFAVSEPEAQAMQDYMRAIFPDQRDSGADAAAPDDATGIYIDMHSYSELVLWPWGYTNDIAPNGNQLQTLGRKLAYWNGYTPQKGYSLYPTDGTTKDFCYGDLGVASYTFEIGTAFFQDCSVYYDEILPDNLPALTYAAKVVRTPYITAAGPNAYDVAVSGTHVPAGTPVSLTATLDDTQHNDTNGVEPVQDIEAAEYYINIPPWVTSPPPMSVPLSPSDGSFDNPIESAEATIDTTGWSEGQHIIFVRGQDGNGTWGAFGAVFLNIGHRDCIDNDDCDDGLFCNGTESCDPETGCHAGQNPCPERACDEGHDICGCLDDAECDDGLYCNGAETCLDDACQAGAPVNCDDGIPCTVDTCDDGLASCQNAPDDNACDDADECTEDICSPGLGCENPAIPGCTICISFHASLAEHEAQGRATTQTETDCSDCWFGCVWPFNCSRDVTAYYALGSNQSLGTDGNATVTLYSQDAGESWSTDECTQTFCSQHEDCGDGLFCNGEETCVNRICQPGVAVDCNDDVACTADWCDDSAGACQNVPENDICDDADSCTTDICNVTWGCVNEPIPDCSPCLPDGSYCSGDDECCSGDCRGFWIFRTCG